MLVQPAVLGVKLSDSEMRSICDAGKADSSGNLMLRSIETHMYKSAAFVVAFGLVSFLFSASARAQTKAAKPPALVSADWLKVGSLVNRLR